VSALGGKVLPEPGVLWEEEGEDNVAPDVAVVLADRLGIVQEKIRGAPNLVVEILSTGIEARRRDLEAKRDLYLRRGVVEYWVIELDTRCLRRMTRGLSDWVGAEVDTRGPAGPAIRERQSDGTPRAPYAARRGRKSTGR
jgi:Uma2 family endonuclease